MDLVIDEKEAWFGEAEEEERIEEDERT